MRLIILNFIFLLTTSCADLSYKDKSLALLSGAVTSGYILGQSNTPVNESASLHGLLWAGVFGTVAGALSPYVFKDELEGQTNLEELESLRSKVKILENKVPNKNGTNAFLEKPLPKEFSNLIQPGGWKIYSMDEWIRDGDERLIHQDKMIEFTLPQIKEK